MANAPRDNNGVATLIGTLNTTGASTIVVLASPTSHAIKVVDGTTGSDHGSSNALRDANSVPALLAVSSVDGITPVPVYVDSNGNLLIQTT